MLKNSIKSAPRKGSHLTIEDRAKIEYGLNKGHSIRAIAKEIGKSPSSVKREIERNASPEKTPYNDCASIGSCRLRGTCGDIKCSLVCSKACKESCHLNCGNYKQRICERLEASPHVCNGCPRYTSSYTKCFLSRRVYAANEAHAKYREILSERRKGFDLTLAELIDIDNVVSPLLKKGQSPFHIMQNNILPVSLSTLYRIVDSGELEAGNIDLKQKLRRKPRKTPRHGEKISKKIQEAKVGHMYGDFLKYMSEHDTFHVEMDTVIGKRDENPALLTLHYPGLQMQLAFYMAKHSAFNVVTKIDAIEHLLGYELFRETFPVILTDNGGEFADVKNIERSVFNPERKRTNLFFCEPNRSDEKASCENNHRLIREVIPKGITLKPYAQEDITLMMNHINSYCRKKSFGSCAYDLAMKAFPEEYFDLLGLYKIHANDVVLKPTLLRRAYSAAINS